MSSTNDDWRGPAGATPGPGGSCEFVVWAPNDERVVVHLLGPHERCLAMTKNSWGYHQVLAQDVEPGTRYRYRFEDGREYADPASRFQPEGVHGPSEIVDLAAFAWTDHNWRPPTLEESVFYELHVGTFSPEGTLEALCGYLPELAALGITTIELMPIAQFPGTRNWGYDGVYSFAVQNSYGGPGALQRFVNEAHSHGLAVALDVVYNHLGPEGNYLPQFGPYFTGRYKTPWGDAINYDDVLSGPVRWFFINNALYWFENFHIDVLRLDAIHGIFDFGGLHLLAELQKETDLASERLGRRLHLVAESDLNDARILQSPATGGYGLSAQWSDDFHHALHTLLTHEQLGYYADFGSLHQLAEVLREGWFYHGQYSKYRRRQHGNSPRGLSRSHFVVCIQNHDQIGNRAWGERLSTLVNFECQKLAAGMVLLSPFVPLLFMGEEYGETAPFLYFTSHGDQDLVEAVRRGRRQEFSDFGWKDEVPDPHAEETFQKSKLARHLRDRDRQGVLCLFYQELIRFRRASQLGREAEWEVRENDGLDTLTLSRPAPGPDLLMVFNFGTARASVPAPAGRWETKIDSAESRWMGPGSEVRAVAGGSLTLAGQSFVVLGRERGD